MEFLALARGLLDLGGDALAEGSQLGLLFVEEFCLLGLGRGEFGDLGLEVGVPFLFGPEL